MPSLMKLARLGTLPETRHAFTAAARSPATRELARRIATDRAALAREVRSPSRLLNLLVETARHPATRELGGVGLMFLPGRYLGVGWAAGWAARRVWRRFNGSRDPATSGADGRRPPPPDLPGR